MIPIALAVARAAVLSPAVRAAVMAALQVLRSRGLAAINIEMLRDALIASGQSGAWVAANLGRIAGALF